MNFVEEINWKIFEGGSTPLRNALEALIGDAGVAHGSIGEDFVKDLLRRYTYFSRDDYDAGIFELAQKIHGRFDMGKTLLCATAADHQKDSAQMVLYDLTTAMGFYGHLNIHSANRYDRAQKFAGRIDDIVLVDEFVGTGRSIVGRVTSISKQFQDKNIAIPNIHAFVIAGMDFGIDIIREKVASVHAHKLLKPGLRGFLNGQSLIDAYLTLDAIEGGLASIVEGQTLPSRGDGGCEALYARKMGNCPNSVLPMFWWPQNENGTARNRPFTRVF
jgi:hypothetical protein